jgi:hypothetical protein
VLEVFRFAWFAVRTFFGVIALVLALEAALWAFVKIHSTLMSNADSDAALKRVTTYNAPGIGDPDREAAASLGHRSDCRASRRDCGPISSFGDRYYWEQPLKELSPKLSAGTERE